MKQKGLAPILIILLIAAAIGGYFIYQNQTKPTPPPTTQPIPNPTVSPAPTDANETTNWKTYTSQKKEFSFQYPYFWYSEAIPVYKDGPAVSFVNEEDVRFFKKGEETSIRTQRMAKGNEQLIVSVSSAQSFDDLKKSLNLNIPPILIQGKQALRYATGVYILLDPTQNRILSLYRPQYPDEGYLDKILSTFKFLP